MNEDKKSSCLPLRRRTLVNKKDSLYLAVVVVPFRTDPSEFDSRGRNEWIFDALRKSTGNVQALATVSRLRRRLFGKQ
jgi:hypothetical protein